MHNGKFIVREVKMAGVDGDASPSISLDTNSVEYVEWMRVFQL